MAENVRVDSSNRTSVILDYGSRGEAMRRIRLAVLLIVDFLDVVTRGEKGIEFRLEEFGVPEESPLANYTTGDLQIGEKTGAMVLATRSTEGNFDTTPSAQDEIHPGDTLIVLGTREQIERLEALMTGKEPADVD